MTTQRAIARVRSQLSRRGHRGGKLLPHRSIWSLSLPPHRLLGGLLLAGLFSAALYWLQPWVEEAFSLHVLVWFDALGLAGHFVPAAAEARSLFLIATPRLDVATPALGPLALALHALVLVVIWIAAGLLPDRATPARYLARFGVLIHTASLVFFTLWPQYFPHTAYGHLEGGLRQGWALMLLTPWLHLATYYLLPFAPWQRLMLTAMTLAFLMLFTPLLVASHAAALALFGLVMLPMLTTMFGVLMPILGIVALYGWAMSWHDTDVERDFAAS